MILNSNFFNIIDKRKNYVNNKKTIYNELGYVHALRQDYKTGLENINIYKAMAPDEPNPYDSAGEILMFAGRYEEAVPQLETALSIDPTFYHSAVCRWRSETCI